jgi:hypothetical protein
MALDTSIAQSIDKLDVIGNQSKGFTLGYALKQAGREDAAYNQDAQDEMTLKDAFAKNNPDTIEGQNAITQMTKGKISTARTSALQDQFEKRNNMIAQQAQRLAGVDKEKFAEIKQKQTDLHDGMFGVDQAAKGIDKQIDKDVASGHIKKEDAAVIIQNMKNNVYQSTVKQLVENGTLTPDALKGIPPNYDENFMNAQLSQSKLHQAAIAAAEKNRHDIEMETLRFKEAQVKANAEAAGEWKTETIMKDGKPHSVSVNKRTGEQRDLGEAGAKGGIRGGTGGAFQQKVANNYLSSMQDIRAAAKNVGNMPLTSGQMFHIDPVNHILQAPEAWLKGERTSDEAAQFKTYITSVGIAVAQLKDLSYKPNASSIAELQKIYEAPPGTSRQTLMIKLAHLRQDAELGVEQSDTNPNLTDEQRALGHKALEDIQKAIPYTIEQIQNIQYTGEERSRETGAKFTGQGKADAVDTSNPLLN